MEHSPKICNAKRYRTAIVAASIATGIACGQDETKAQKRLFIDWDGIKIPCNSINGLPYNPDYCSESKITASIPGFQGDIQIREAISKLVECVFFTLDGVQFFSEKPPNGTPYTPIYVGGRARPHTNGGDISGVATIYSEKNHPRAFVADTRSNGKSIDPETLAAAICHEVGHLLGIEEENKNPREHSLMSLPARTPPIWGFTRAEAEILEKRNRMYPNNPRLSSLSENKIRKLTNTSTDCVDHIRLVRRLRR